MFETNFSDANRIAKRGINPRRHWFITSAGTILAITAIAKACSAFGDSRYLLVADPVTGLHFGHLMLATATVEIIIAYLCLFSARETFALTLVAWLSTNFIVYRLALRFLGWHRPCACLGNLTDALHIPPEAADNLLKIALGYLLIGSFFSLFHKLRVAIRPSWKR
jgi:hypothetical protein